MIKSIISNIIIIISMIIIFFGYTLGSVRIALILLSIMSVIGLLLKNKLHINFSNVLFILLCIISSITLLYTIDKNQSIPYVISLWALLLIQIFFDNTQEKNEKIGSMLFLISGIHVFFTISNSIIPELITLISSKILTNDDFIYNQLVHLNGSNAGITNETGTNAIFVSVFTGFSLIKLSISQKKFKYLLFTLVGILALLMTNKRGILIATIIGLVYIIFLTNKNQNNLKFRLMLTLSTFIIIAIVGKSSYFNDFLEYNLRKGNGDFSNGRLYLWYQTWSFVKQSPFLGNGISTMYSELNSGTHNVYLQILSEIGIFGFMTLVIYFINNIIQAYKNIKIKMNVINLYSIYFQLIFVIYCFTGNPIYNYSFFLLYIVSSNLYKTKYEKNK